MRRSCRPMRCLQAARFLDRRRAWPLARAACASTSRSSGSRWRRDVAARQRRGRAPASRSIAQREHRLLAAVEDASPRDARSPARCGRASRRRRAPPTPLCASVPAIARRSSDGVGARLVLAAPPAPRPGAAARSGSRRRRSPRTLSGPSSRAARKAASAAAGAAVALLELGERRQQPGARRRRQRAASASSVCEAAPRAPRSRRAARRSPPGTRAA